MHSTYLAGESKLEVREFCFVIVNWERNTDAIQRMTVPVLTGLAQLILELHSSVTHLSEGTGRTAWGTSDECLKFYGTNLYLSLSVAKNKLTFSIMLLMIFFSCYFVRPVDVLEGSNLLKMVCQVVFLFPKLEVKHASRNSGGARRNCLSSRWNTAVEMFASVRSSGSWLPSSVELNGSQELGVPASLRCRDSRTCSPLVPQCRLWDPVRMFLTSVVPHWPFYNLVWQFWCSYLKIICCFNLRWKFSVLFFRFFYLLLEL